MTTTSKPTVLIILDGFGHRQSSESNAIKAANTPTWDQLWSGPHGLISGSGNDVGLPDGQMGNSEVGHMNLGSGRIVYQDFTRITKAITDGDFFVNPVLTQAVSQGKALHIMGLLSSGGVHSHEQHIHAMIKLAHQQGVKQVYVHAFLDGRDTPPRSAEASLVATHALLEELGCGQIASICGRYYAMDRDQRWERIEQAYRALVKGQADYQASTAEQGLAMAYARDENDEFVKPTLIVKQNNQACTIQDDDAVIFMNFRADRARQITRALTDPDFNGFQRDTLPKLADFVTLTQYADDIKAHCAFPPISLPNVLGEYLSHLGKKQLRIAETEKYAHVTFFFNGGREQSFAGEDRILVPSPKVATYDLQPEMSAAEVTCKLVEAIKHGGYDAIICNYANGDMVGHTGNFAAAVKAVEVLDDCLKQVTEALKAVGGQCLITADHGNCEKMFDPQTGQPHTAHTSEPVPLVYVGNLAVEMRAQGGTLADVAPSLLTLMGLPQPQEMTGRSLLNIKDS
jgi:2,3-bisphosphoglycerate-independent phosphoglycerate mutase